MDEATAARDPGLQPERTRLAWRRTTLAYTVAAVLAVRLVLHHGGSPAGVMAAGLAVPAWVAFLAVAHRRVLALAAPRPGAVPPRAAGAAALCVAVLAVLGVPLVL